MTSPDPGDRTAAAAVTDPASQGMRSFLLSAWHGAAVVFDPEKELLRHVRRPARSAMQRPTRLCRLISDPDLALLLDGSSERPVTLVLVEEVDQDWIRVSRPGDLFRLAVVIGSEEHDSGGIAFHQPSGSVRERFQLLPEEPAGRPWPDAVPALLDIQAAAGSLRSSAAVATRLPSMLPDLLAAIPPDALRGMVAELAGTTAWPDLFPVLRSRLGEGEPVHPRATRELMRDKIAYWGWEIGEHSYGEPIVLDGTGSFLRIGRFCSIAGNVVVALGNHVTRTVTTFPFVALGRQWPTAAATPALADHVPGPVSIGHDVWIGFGAVILPGVTIGHGSVIGANAVVTGDVAPYSIVAGNPARCIRRRFDEESIERLLKLRWWDWPDDRIDRFIPLLLDPDISRFLDAAEDDPPPG